MIECNAELNKTRVVRKSNWLEQMREKKEQRQPSALQKQAAEAHSAAGRQKSQLSHPGLKNDAVRRTVIS
jgi:hypothetical protein